MTANWQDALWTVVNSAGRWWDIIVGLIALGTSLGLFLKMIMHQPFDLVVGSRCIIALGLFGVFCNIFNSGWGKISIAMIVIGLALTYVLIATDWCNRPDKSVTLWRLAGRWLNRQIHPEGHIAND